MSESVMSQEKTEDQVKAEERAAISEAERKEADARAAIRKSELELENAEAFAKAEIDKKNAEAAKDIAAANLAKLRSELELDTAEKLAEISAAKAISEGEKAQFEASKAKAEAEKIEIEAKNAAIKAKYGDVTKSSFANGTTKVGTGAGAIEASLLAAKAVEEITQQLAQELSGQCDNEYIIFVGEERPTIDHYQLFLLQKEVLANTFAKSVKSYDDAKEADQDERNVVPQANVSPFVAEAAGATITAAGAILESAANLGSYLLTDYDIAGVDADGIDDQFLAFTLAGKLGNAWYPAYWSGTSNLSLVADLITENSSYREALQQKGIIEKNKSFWQEKITEKTGADKKKTYEGIIELYNRALSDNTLAQESYVAFITSFANEDTEGRTVASKIVIGKKYITKIDSGAKLLFLKLNKAKGDGYTKKSLWTSFTGGIPFYVMGGAVVSYMVVNGKSGAIEKSGHVKRHGGFHKLNKVKGKINSEKTASSSCTSISVTAENIDSTLKLQGIDENGKEQDVNSIQEVELLDQEVKNVPSGEK